MAVLVSIQAITDLTEEFLKKPWEHHLLAGQILVGAYGLVALMVLFRGQRR